MKLFNWRNKAKWIDEYKAQKDLYNSKLYWILSYCSFYNYWCISISSFASLVDIPIGITSSAIELKVSAITAEIKSCKPIIKKKKKKWDRKVLSAKLNRVEVLISKVCFKVCYVFINHVLKEYNEMKKEIKN